MDPAITVALIGALAAVGAALVKGILDNRKKEPQATVFTPVPPRAVQNTNIYPTLYRVEKSVNLRKQDWIDAYAYIQEITTWMRNDNYPDEAISSFEVVFTELLRNVLEHGCVSETDQFGLQIKYGMSNVTLTFTNPKGRKFDIEKLLGERMLALSENPSLARGRGLLLVADLADVFEGIPDNQGVRATLFSDRVSLSSTTVEDEVILVETLAGLSNLSYPRRLMDYILASPQTNVILDYRPYSLYTVTASTVLELGELFNKQNRRIVALLGDKSRVILPDAIVAYTLNEAIRKVKSSDPNDARPDPKQLIHALMNWVMQLQETNQLSSEEAQKLQFILYRYQTEQDLTEDQRVQFQHLLERYQAFSNKPGSNKAKGA